LGSRTNHHKMNSQNGLADRIINHPDRRFNSLSGFIKLGIIPDYCKKER